MADNKDIDSKKLEKAMGLLGIATDGSVKSAEPAGEKGQNCLSGEQLAAHIDGSCSPAEIEKIKEHLGTCKICYNQWLTLTALKMEVMKGSRVVANKRVKIIKYIIYAITLGATVAIFLKVIDLASIPLDQGADSQVVEERKAVDSTSR
jgi:hypothetical protein